MTDSLSFETPEFIAWCLVRECPVRGRFDLDDPLQTERRLKSLRAAAIGWMEGRVVEGWVVEPSFTNRDPVELRGFPLADVVDRWGGSAQLTELCGSCPANALQRSYEIDPANLQFYFREMADFLHDCRYPGCTHDHEPECAVRAAVECGTIDAERYESYLRLLHGEE